MKQHLEEEDLILHFYGETGTAAEPHLSDCAACRGRYQSLERVLNSVDLKMFRIGHRSMRIRFGTDSSRSCVAGTAGDRGLRPGDGFPRWRL